jgi:DNA-binding CsgD family transcriptional regulator
VETSPISHPIFTQESPEMPIDKRLPIPPAARALVDEAIMDIAEQQKYLVEILEGGKSDSEIFRRVGLSLAKANTAIQTLKEAEAIGRIEKQATE